MSIGLIKGLMIALAATVAVSATVYVVRQQNGAGDQGVEEQAEVNTSLRSLIDSNASLVCTYEYTPEGGAKVTGTTYIDNGRVRGDFKMDGSVSGESHMILKNETIHTWMVTAQGTFGTTFNAPETSASATTSAATGVSLDTPVDYECRNWTPEESKFEIPTDIEFRDMNAFINSGTSVGTGVNAAGAGVTGSTSVDVNAGASVSGNASQCGACALILDATAKAQCLASLQCN